MGTLINANPHGNHYHPTRRRPILAIVEHVTAGLEDLDATDDHSAESTARYAASTDRAVSWHQGTDTDSTVVLLPDTYTAFHVHNYNSCTLGREISKRHTDWRSMPAKWVARTLHQASISDAEWCLAHDIPVRKATQAELDAAITLYRSTGEVRPVGFIGHWELDEHRRSDPGRHGAVDTFPWSRYLAMVRARITPTPSSEETDMLIIRAKGGNGIWLLSAVGLTPLTPDDVKELTGKVPEAKLDATTFEHMRGS